MSKSPKKEEKSKNQKLGSDANRSFEAEIGSINENNESKKQNQQSRNK